MIWYPLSCDWFPLAVIGCPLPETPFNSYIQGEGDHIVVRCNYTTEAWHLTCQKGAWIGDVGNCSIGTRTHARTHARTHPLRRHMRHTHAPTHTHACPSRKHLSCADTDRAAPQWVHARTHTHTHTHTQTQSQPIKDRDRGIEYGSLGTRTHARTHPHTHRVQACIGDDRHCFYSRHSKTQIAKHTQNRVCFEVKHSSIMTNRLYSSKQTQNIHQSKELKTN